MTVAITNDFDGRLLPNERIQWVGKPPDDIRFSARDIFLVPFSLAWLGFAVFWTFSAASGGAPVFFWVWGAGFVAIGVFFAFGRFAVDAWMRSLLSYAVTDRRVLILRARPFAKFQAVDIQRLSEIELYGESNGRGSIRFGQAPNFFTLSGSSGMGFWSPAFDPTPQFLYIEDARRVFDLVNRAQTRP